MSFSLTPELEEWQKRVRELVEAKIAPGAQQREETGKFPWDMMELLRQEGILTSPFPREYGGAGASLLQLCVTIEELCRACNNTAVLIVYMAMANYILQKVGSEAQKAKYLPLLAEGNTVPTFVLTDEAGGTDVAAMETAAVLKGDEYVINGVKRFISSAHVSDIFIVYAKTDPRARHRGISAFILERKPGEKVPGLTIKKERLMSMHSSGACEMRFKNVHIPRENLIGEENGGFKLAMNSLNYSRPLVGSRGVGTAQGALDCALDFARQRKAFGQPIGAFQGIQFMLANMAARVMAARQMVYMSADHYDRGGDNTTLYSSMAKMFASEVAMKVTTDAVQILGGRGVSRDYPVQRLMKDAKIIQIAEGTTEAQQMVIARKLLGRLD